jgi:hypothetical protein
MARKHHLWFALVGLIVACAESTEAGPTICPEGTVDANGDPADGCESTCEKTGDDDPIDADFKDENCDGSDGVLSRCLFVAASGIDAPNAGSAKAPMKTLAYALSQARDRDRDVCLAAETFEGPVRVPAGVRIVGGFDPKTFRRSRGLVTTIKAKGTVVVAEQIDRDTYLEGLHLVAATPDGPLKGEGAYAVRLLSGSAILHLSFNLIEVGPGQDGEPGGDGGPGSPGADGKDGKPGCNDCASIPPNGGSLGGESPASPCGGAAGGVGGQGGYDQSGGMKGGDGSGPGSTGGGGGSGNATCSISSGGPGTVGGSPTQAGETGEEGPPAPAKGSLKEDATFSVARAGDGKPGKPGHAGGGGGGGGGGSNGGLCNGDRGSGGGSGGTGGCGGQPGTGGGNGGASFGVSARGGRVVAKGNRMTIALGGKGGNGGKGGDGGPGGKPGKGGPKSPDEGGAGADGGQGSQGGRGGGGAGGNGGPCACFAIHSSVTLLEPVQNVCTTSGGGTGGFGGNGGPNAGAEGESGPILKY